MILHVIFGQRTCSYPGEYGPEVIDCWDENCVDDNPEGFDEAIEKAKARMGGKNPEFTSVRVLDVGLDGDKIDRLLNKTPSLAGEIITK